MGRTWAKQEVDVNILEKLYEVKSLRGKTLAKLYTPEKIQKGYDRLDALKKNKLIAGVKYCEVENIGTEENPIKRGKKKGTMFYLTAKGVEEVKKLRGIPLDGNERTRIPDEEYLPILYIMSLLIENTGLSFISGREFKIENEIPNYVTIDLVCNDWIIIIEREPNMTYRKKLCHLIKSINKNTGISNKYLILTRTEAARANAIKVWREEYGPDARFMVQDNYEGIKNILTSNTIPEIIWAIDQNKGDVKTLPQPEDGYTHSINGERCIIVDLIGLSTRAIRQLSSALYEGLNPYVGIENISDLNLIVNRFPEILRPGYKFFTLDGIMGDSAAVTRMFSKKKGV